MKNVYYVAAALVSWLWPIGFVIGFVVRPLWQGFSEGFNVASNIANAENQRLLLEVQKERLEKIRNGQS